MKTKKKKPVMMKFAVGEQVSEMGALRIKEGKVSFRRKAGTALKAVDFRADEIGSQIADALNSISNEIKSTSRKLAPNKLIISLSGTVSGNVGIIWVAKASAEATIEVTAEWNFGP